MKTTALRIEILLIGFQSLIWSFFLVGLSLDSLAEELKKLKDIAVFVTVLLFAWSYTVGSLIDSLTGILEVEYRRLFSKEMKNGRCPKLWLKYPDVTGDIMHKYFDLRLLRSTAFNTLVFLCVAVYLKLGWLVILLSGVFTAVTLYSWGIRRRSLSHRLDKLSDFVKSEDTADKPVEAGEGS